MYALRIEVSFHSAILTISFCQGVSIDIVVHKRVGVRTARRASNICQLHGKSKTRIYMNPLSNSSKGGEMFGGSSVSVYLRCGGDLNPLQD
jgi:hypothetical protein